MSDFLARLVARHVEPSAIVPRAVSRFEAPREGVAWAKDAVASPVPFDHESVTPTTGPVREDDAPLRSSVREQQATGRSRHMPSGRVNATREIGHEPEAQSDARPRAHHPESRAAVGRAAENVESTVPSSRRNADEEHAVAPRTVVTKVIPRSDAAEPRSSRDNGSGSPRVSNAEHVPDVVRVHIGRVEVRAMLPSTEPPRQRAKPNDASPPMSLDRYLGGKDRA